MLKCRVNAPFHGTSSAEHDREMLEETYELIIKTGFSVPPYPAGISSCKYLVQTS